MSKKFKVIISLLVAVLLLAISGTTIAMAQDEPDADLQPEAKGLLARAAEILGITQEQMATAFEQARQEMREECQATGDCTLRQERANQFKECWMEKRQQRGERNQQWIEQRQESHQRLQCDGTSAEQSRLRISEAVRGRQMIAVP